MLAETMRGVFGFRDRESSGRDERPGRSPSLYGLKADDGFSDVDDIWASEICCGKGRRMRTFFAVTGVTVALMTPAVASGAVLEKGAGVGCPAGQQGTFAFVANQVTSLDPGTVTASFDSGETWTVGPTYVSKKTREYFVNAYGKLLSARSSLDGKLVLDRFWCFPPA